MNKHIHNMRATCCFLDLSYPFQLDTNCLQGPISLHDLAIKAVYPLPGLLFLRITGDPPIISLSSGLEKQKTLA